MLLYNQKYLFNSQGTPLSLLTMNVTLLKSQQDTITKNV